MHEGLPRDEHREIDVFVDKLYHEFPEAYHEYVTLSDKVERALYLARQTSPNLTTSTKKIDDILSENPKLLNYEDIEAADPEILLLVAARFGFRIDMCHSGSHTNPRARANGSWINLSQKVGEILDALYMHIDYKRVCPRCIKPDSPEHAPHTPYYWTHCDI